MSNEYEISVSTGTPEEMEKIAAMIEQLANDKPADAPSPAAEPVQQNTGTAPETPAQ
jgi:uncharacterized ferredoxin-like protein